EQESQSVVDRLMGLSRLSWQDPQAVLGFERPLPAWAWALVVLAAAGVAGWSYSRLLGPRSVRIALAGARALVLLVLAVLLAGPQLVRPEERIERDWLLVLVDRSASMQVLDSRDPATDQPMSRDQVLKEALAKQAEVFSPEGLGQGKRIVWLGFGAQVRPIAPAQQADRWGEPDEPATALRTAIEQALRTAAGAPVSAVVLFTDGRSPQATGPELVQRLQQQAAPVFAVPLGVTPAPLDLALDQVEAPQRAFVNDQVPVSVTVDRLGGKEGPLPGSVKLRLTDAASGRVLDERTLRDEAWGEPQWLRGKSSQAGKARWQVEVVYEPAAGGAADEELLTSNNRRQVVVELVDRPLRVLYIEGYPRWEYRYLQSMLVREASIDSSMYLFSADRDFAQEGDTPIARLPETAEEIAPYDVVILGDVPAGSLSTQQMVLLRDQVASRGAGLLWIGGERWTPASYEATPLADLLPMQRPGSVSRLGGALDLWQAQPTALARSLSVLELRGPEGASSLAEEDDQAGWPAQVPALRWVQGVGALKPAVEVLAQVSGPEGGEAPLILLQRFGAGRSLYVATDDTWRWRYGRGELYFEQFWIQLVRMLGRQRLDQSGAGVRLAVSQRQVGVEEPVVVELVVEDGSPLSRPLPSVAVSVHAGESPDAEVVDRIELRPATEDGPPRTYRAIWRPGSAGPRVLRVAEPVLADLGIHQAVQVVAPDDEWRQTQPDHARLAQLAQQTGGQVVSLDQLDRLTELVPNRARKTPDDIREPLSHSPLALALMLGLLGGEWVGRKAIRLA
ncbi:MAG TPA: hypothetical protein VF184_13900, partial [Phycisphaeraceae bacterium]